MLQPENKFKEKITAIILCAGEGARAKDITNLIPKPLVKVKSYNDQSILSLIINNLMNLELNPIVLVTGHLGKHIVDYVKFSQARDLYGDYTIMINSSRTQYKLGPLHSFLSITTNSQIFKNDIFFMVFPGDTVFDYPLLHEILTLLLENYSQIINNSIIFYRKIKVDYLMKKLEKYYPSYEKSIAYLKIEQKDSTAIVKEISQGKLSSFSKNEVINQIIPIFIFNTHYVKTIKKLTSTVRYRYIREVVNLMIKKGMNFFALSVNPEYEFYDIDTPLDLKILNEIKKGGQ